MDDDEHYEQVYRPMVDALTEIADIADGTTARGRYVATDEELRAGLRQIEAVMKRVEHLLIA